MADSWIDASSVYPAYQAMRKARPLVMCITNYVSMDICANALLASGASPAMVNAQEEIQDFLDISSALYINAGTISSHWFAAMQTAAEHAKATGKPWVLDPVGMGATPYRSDCIKALAQLSPACIRGNASEILALAASLFPDFKVDGPTKGVDSSHESDSAISSASQLAKELGCVVAVSGATDYVVEPSGRVTGISNGHPMMTLITATGCSLTAVIAAFLGALPKDKLSDANTVATSIVSALGVFAVAGEVGKADSKGPGTLRVKLLDNLHVFGEDVAEGRKAMKSLRIAEKKL